MIYMQKLLLCAVVILFSNVANAKSAPESFADLVEELTPSVVNISTTQTIEGGQDPFSGLNSFNVPGGSPFSDLPELFKKFYKDDGQSMEHKTTSLGSGFIIDADGYIVTNYHVIKQADEITVTLSNDKKLQAKVIGKDAKTDIAVLKVESDEKLPFVKWGNSDKARVGDWVIAIGNPFGLGGAVSAGIISARARDINAGPFDDFIQTDAAINRGNSGGPMFNMKGEVIGVNAAIFSPSGGNVGIGFAIPSALSWPVVKQLKETGHLKRGWLGVKIQTVTDDIAESLDLAETMGALVLEVTKGSPADKAGILSGDVVLSFDGKNVATMRKLPRIVAETEVNKKVAVIVWRNEKKKTLVVTVAKLNEEQEAGELAEDDSFRNDADKFKPDDKILGLGLSDLREKIREKFAIDDSVLGALILDIESDSLAASKPLIAGDVIVAVNQTPVKNVKEVVGLIKKAIANKRKSVLLLINRDGVNLFMAIPTTAESIPN